MRPDRTYVYCERFDIVLYFVLGFAFCLLAAGLILEHVMAAESTEIPDSLAWVLLGGIVLSGWLFRRHVKQHRIEIQGDQLRVYSRIGFFSHVGIGVIVSVMTVVLCLTAGFEPVRHNAERIVLALSCLYSAMFLAIVFKSAKWAEFDMCHSEMRVWQSEASFILTIQRDWGGGISLAGQFDTHNKCLSFCDDMVERFQATRREFTIHVDDRVFLGMTSPCYVPIPQEKTWMAVVPDRLNENCGNEQK